MIWGFLLRKSSSWLPRTDGTPEVINGMLENYLRWYCDHNRKDWNQFVFLEMDGAFKTVPKFKLMLLNFNIYVPYNFNQNWKWPVQIFPSSVVH